MDNLREGIQNHIIELQLEIDNIFARGRNSVVSEITVGQIYGGMRGLVALACNTSYVDPYSGLYIGKYTTNEFSDKLPEEIFFLLSTGKFPDKESLADFQNDLNKRAKVPQYTWDVLRSLPKDTHPMTMLSLGILSMENESVFKKEYRKGLQKADYWKYTLEDAMNILAKLPELAAGIYRIRFGDGNLISYDSNLNWSGNLAHMLGVNNDEGFADLMRLYLVLHCDHEGGNVSAFTSRVVNSALSDLYYAVSAGLNGLAGPLHGLANQECLRFILKIHDKFGADPDEEVLRAYILDVLNSGKVIPGYGHAVLRVTDPRFTAFMKFGEANCANNHCFKIAKKLFSVVPDILMHYKEGKVANPWPNVDAMSGSLLHNYGLNEFDFYTVLFGVSRVMGFCAQNILALGLGQPIIRPKSVTNKWVIDKLDEN
ncbi:citrate (Si)-synthase [Labilibaculum sp. A4]|uniref:citrate (Si)-synthase n=1 Tax=Labilibaculum euxinus TaxID=2686357 RepID=UPI000F61AACF|nr:citrate (Si)-synthase [Labilibaculum euxinus]MDQ1771956.1 citrate (Si)-synthase [Labilibaculum euxinus]MWN75693.1 citrate (Si)-synthase [Labilibaculum euxinus]